MSIGLPSCAICQSSIVACSESRFFSSIRFSGAKRPKISATPDQKLSAASPVPGSASSSMKRTSGSAIFNPALSIIFTTRCILSKFSRL